MPIPVLNNAGSSGAGLWGALAKTQTLLHSAIDFSGWGFLADPLPEKGTH